MVIQRAYTLKEAGIDEAAFADSGEGGAGQPFFQAGQGIPAGIDLLLQVQKGFAVHGINEKNLIQRQLILLILLIAGQGQGVLAYLVY